MTLTTGWLAFPFLLHEPVLERCYERQFSDTQSGGGGCRCDGRADRRASGQRQCRDAAVRTSRERGRPERQCEQGAGWLEEVRPITYRQPGQDHLYPACEL